MKILIIEDEVLLADSLKAILQKKGFEVKVCYDGESGTDYALLGIYDLLILDVMMPKMNGFDVCKNIRQAKINVPNSKKTKYKKLLKKAGVKSSAVIK